MSKIECKALSFAMAIRGRGAAQTVDFAHQRRQSGPVILPAAAIRPERNERKRAGRMKINSYVLAAVLAAAAIAMYASVFVRIGG
jgi:hypothetical protein